MSTDVEERIRDAARDIRAQNLEPIWIILGQEEWYDLRRAVDTMVNFSLGPGSIPMYYSLNIATVPIKNHLEVLPKVPR